MSRAENNYSGRDFLVLECFNKLAAASGDSRGSVFCSTGSGRSGADFLGGIEQMCRETRRIKGK
jgi:hypothetical protein